MTTYYLVSLIVLLAWTAFVFTMFYLEQHKWVKNSCKISPRYTYEQLRAEWETRDKWEAEHPYRAFIARQYRRVRAFFLNLPDAPRDAYRKVKRGWQRGWRGWSDEDVWCWFAYDSRITLAALKHLKKTKHGIPATADPRTGEYDYDEARWDAILDKMIYAYELNCAIADGDRENYSSTLDEQTSKEVNCLTIKEEMDRRVGMFLYVNYYFSLWD